MLAETGKLNFDPRLTSKRKISDSSKLSFLSEVLSLSPKVTLNISFTLPSQCHDMSLSLEEIAAEVTQNCRYDQLDGL